MCVLVLALHCNAKVFRNLSNLLFVNVFLVLQYWVYSKIFANAVMLKNIMNFSSLMKKSIKYDTFLKQYTDE